MDVGEAGLRRDVHHRSRVYRPLQSKQAGAVAPHSSLGIRPREATRRQRKSDPGLRRQPGQSGDRFGSHVPSPDKAHRRMLPLRTPAGLLRENGDRIRADQGYAGRRPDEAAAAPGSRGLHTGRRSAATPNADRRPVQHKSSDLPIKGRGNDPAAPRSLTLTSHRNGCGEKIRAAGRKKSFLRILVPEKWLVAAWSTRKAADSVFEL